MRLRISARKSDLARLQAYMVGDALKKTQPGLEIEYRFKESLGDKNLTDPLWQIPEKGVFTEDFYSELLKEETDMVVHSWKDLPTEGKSDTQIVATLPRADQRDLLIVKKSHLEKIRESQTLKIFSSSPRREYNLTGFLKTHLPLNLQSVSFMNVRGNIPTRMRKLLESTETDGLILAKAALDRLLSAEQEEFAETRQQLRSYMGQLEWVVLPLSVNPNAAAQGALAVEIASHRTDLKDILKKINEPETFAAAQKERDVLSSFGGGCHQKIGVAVLRKPYGEVLFLQGLTDQGQVLCERTLSSPQKSPAFSNEDLGTMTSTPLRKPLPSAFELPSDIDALYVARTEAWPETAMGQRRYVWAAGLKTWQNLAAKGIWVHGCADSLGEQENPSLDILAGKNLHWGKLTHNQPLLTSTSQDRKTFATYELQQDVEIKDLSKKTFFWQSGSQFLVALKKYPQLKDKHHACGPGNTYQIICDSLKKENNFDSQKIQIFLDQEDWKKNAGTQLS